MPSAQVINLNAPKDTEPTPLEMTLSSFSKRQRENQINEKDTDALKDIYGKYQRDGRNLEDALIAIQTRPDISPTRRVEAVNQLMQFQKHNQELQKQASKQLNKKQEPSPEETEKRRNSLIDEGFTENEADEYLKATPGVQQIIYRQHNDLKSRGLRKGKAGPENAPITAPTKNGVVGTGDKPPEGQLGIEDSFSNEADPIDEDAWPEIPAPPKMTPAEEVKWANQNQKENNKLLAQTREKTNANRGIGIRLNRLAQLSDKVPDGAGRLVINPETGEPYAAAQIAGIVNKETQDYVKTLNDFLIDAKGYFGARVTNFDVQAFKSRLPSLMNTADGRRLILKQMQLMNDLESLHGVTLEDGLKTYGRNASYSDILSVADNKVAGKEQMIIKKINDLDTASKYMDQMAKNPEKFSDTVLMQSPDGTFKAMPKSKVNIATERGWSIY